MLDSPKSRSSNWTFPRNWCKGSSTTNPTPQHTTPGYHKSPPFPKDLDPCNKCIVVLVRKLCSLLRPSHKTAWRAKKETAACICLPLSLKNHRSLRTPPLPPSALKPSLLPLPSRPGRPTPRTPRSSSVAIRGTTSGRTKADAVQVWSSASSSVPGPAASRGRGETGDGRQRDDPFFVERSEECGSSVAPYSNVSQRCSAMTWMKGGDAWVRLFLPCWVVPTVPRFRSHFHPLAAVPPS